MPHSAHRLPRPSRPGRRSLAVALPLIAAGGLALAPAGAAERPKPCHDPDAEATRGVCAALDHYLQAHATGDARHAQAAFHERARMVWVADGALSERPIAEYIAGFRGEPAADETRRERWVERIDVAGDAAVAKIVLDYPGARIVDYMTLLRTSGEWRIIHKSFHVDREQGV